MGPTATDLPSWAAVKWIECGVEGVLRLISQGAGGLRDRITASAIAPTLIESDLITAIDKPDADRLPFGRPDEIWLGARMILKTEYLTRQTIHVNAGRYMT